MARRLEREIAQMLACADRVVLRAGDQPRNEFGEELASEPVLLNDLRVLLRAIDAPPAPGACNAVFEGREARVMVLEEPTVGQLTIIFRPSRALGDGVPAVDHINRG